MPLFVEGVKRFSPMFSGRCSVLTSSFLELVSTYYYYYSYIARSGHKPKLRRLLYVPSIVCTYSLLRFSGLSVHTVCCLKSKTRAAHRKTLFNAAATLVKTLQQSPVDSTLLIKTHQYWIIGCNITIYPFFEI